MAFDPIDDLTRPYTNHLIQFSEPPRLEYITSDVAAISHRVDHQCDILLDMAREPIGFRFYLPENGVFISPALVQAENNRLRAENAKLTHDLHIAETVIRIFRKATENPGHEDRG